MEVNKSSTHSSSTTSAAFPSENISVSPGSTFTSTSKSNGNSKGELSSIRNSHTGNNGGPRSSNASINRNSKLELISPRSSNATNFRASTVSSLSFGDSSKHNVVTGNDPRRFLETEEIKTNIKESKRPSSGHFKGKKTILGNNKNLLIFFFFSFFVSFGSALAPGVNWYLNKWKVAIIYLTIATALSTIPLTYTQVLIGYYGDMVDTKFGRRKPLIFIAIIVHVVSMFLIANPPNLLQSTLFYWYFLWHCCNICSAIVEKICFTSWLIESSSNNEDFIKINSIAVNFGTFLGAIAGLVIGYLLLPTLGALVFAIGILVSLYFLLAFVPNDTIRASDKQPDLIPSFRSCMKTKEFQIILFNRILIVSAIGIGFTNGQYLLVIGFPFITKYSQIVSFIIIFGVIYFILGGLATLSLNYLLKIYDKLIIYKFLTFAIAFFGVLIFPCSIFSNITGFYLTSACLLITGIFSFPIITIDGFFVKDLLIYDAFLTGLNRENMYQTAISLPSLLAENVITSIPSVILYATGFVSGTNTVNDDQIISKFLWDDKSLWILRGFTSFVLAGIALLSYCTIKDYPLTDEAANRINDIVKSREDLRRRVSMGAKVLSTTNNSLMHMPAAATNNKLSMVDGFGIQVQDDEEKSSDADPGTGKCPSTVSSLTQSNMTGGNTKTIAESDYAVLMMNFSALEVKAIAYEGIWNVDTLKYKIISGLITGCLVLGLLVYSAVMQILASLETYILLYITLILLVSLYLLYDALRLMAVYKLASLHDDQIIFLAETVAHENARFNITLKESFLDLGIRDTGAKRISSFRGGPGVSGGPGKDDDDDDEAGAGAPGGRATLFVDDNKGKMKLAQGIDENRSFLPGYSRIFLCLAVLIVLGVLGFSVFTNVIPLNPVGHHPTYAPTVPPSS